MPFNVLRHLISTTVHYLELNAGLAQQNETTRLLHQFATNFKGLPTSMLPIQAWQPESVRGLSHLPAVFEAQYFSSAAHVELNQAACAAIALAHWTEFYQPTPWSASFLSAFATGACLGSTGRFYTDQTILGLFLLGPHTFYPPHAHLAEEFYLVVSGEAEFQLGIDSAYTLATPGDVVVHPSNQSHAIRTGSAPLFAIYGWQGALSAPTWYNPTMMDNEDKHYPPFIVPQRLS